MSFLVLSLSYRERVAEGRVRVRAERGITV
jgi:hypothetical protein